MQTVFTNSCVFRQQGITVKSLKQRMWLRFNPLHVFMLTEASICFCCCTSSFSFCSFFSFFFAFSAKPAPVIILPYWLPVQYRLVALLLHLVVLCKQHRGVMKSQSYFTFDTAGRGINSDQSSACINSTEAAMRTDN